MEKNHALYLWWHKLFQRANVFFASLSREKGALPSSLSFAAATPEGGGCIVGAVTIRGKVTPLVDQGDGPIFAVGPCRSGKSSGLVIPTLLQWQESAVVFDIHGELHQVTAAWRETFAGNRVIRFEPLNPSGSDRIDLLKEIRVGTTYALGDARTLAHAFVPASTASEGTSSFWVARAQTALTHYLLEAAERGKTMHDVAVRVRDANALYPDDAAEYSEPVLLDTSPPYNSTVAEKATEGVRNLIMQALAVFLNPSVAATAANGTFSLSDLVESEVRATLYIVANPSEVDFMAPLFRALLTMLLARRVRGQDHRLRLLLLLDDFAALGRLPFLEEAIPYLSVHRVKGYYLTQGRELLNIYGPGSALPRAAESGLRILFPQNNPAFAWMLLPGQPETLMHLRHRETVILSPTGPVATLASSAPGYFDLDYFKYAGAFGAAS